MNVNFEPIIRGLKSDIFEVSNPFHICRIQLQKKKSGVEKCLEILPLRGGGVERLMANAILNFHFDFPHTSLRWRPFSHSPRLRDQGLQDSEVLVLW